MLKSHEPYWIKGVQIKRLRAIFDELGDDDLWICANEVMNFEVVDDLPGKDVMIGHIDTMEENFFDNRVPE